MKLTKYDLLEKIEYAGTKNKKKYIIKYLKLFGIKNRIKRVETLKVKSSSEFSPNYESYYLEGLGFSRIEFYNGEWSTDVYDILNKNKKIENQEVAEAIYSLLAELKE